MGKPEDIENKSAALAAECDAQALLRPLMDAPVAARAPTLHAPVVGELLALAESGRYPLVVYPGQPGAAALRARTVVDLHGAHVGKQVLLVFEAGDPSRPIVTGVMRESDGWPLSEPPGQVEVDADGERLAVSAKRELVLRCGKASITLTASGKVLIQGSYVSSRSTGVNRLKGGSVQLN
ncbi:DUF6484 domain-containing protein [Aquabacterium sp. A7-Y]|uniref:DUF6484 domain-containing protein n=1 Tax=Aquabacterium sp. A7-Y TaxID=1349605 RepID=UPI00223DE84B|nr:DUF6484 domain-containing protein [Aquabacterium sp. A7-Y]MCW7541895.1 DUF6484 domain-containing protein [Aquabacterium sp. A7-Y]